MAFNNGEYWHNIDHWKKVLEPTTHDSLLILTTRLYFLHIFFSCSFHPFALQYCLTVSHKFCTQVGFEGHKSSLTCLLPFVVIVGQDKEVHGKSKRSNRKERRSVSPLIPQPAWLTTRTELQQCWSKFVLHFLVV